MITLKWECPELHKDYTKARVITHVLEDEATLDEMLDAYVDFLKGIGYSVPQYSYLEFVTDDEPILHLVKNDN